MTPDEVEAFLGLVSYEDWVRLEDDSPGGSVSGPLGHPQDIMSQSHPLASDRPRAATCCGNGS